MKIIECTYCGIAANSLDHIIPVSYNQTLRKNVKYSKENTVPSCTECNSSLSNIWLPTIPERAGCLLEKYNKKYKKLLNQPEWEDWEIEELGPGMKKVILTNKKKKEIIIERLNVLMHVFTNSNLTIEDVWDKYPEDSFGKFR